MIATATLFPLEGLLGLPPLKLSPVVPLFAATTFLVKGAILSGRFYLQAIALFATSIVMALLPDYGHLIMGVVAALCFLLPGIHYHRARLAREREDREGSSHTDSAAARNAPIGWNSSPPVTGDR